MSESTSKPWKIVLLPRLQMDAIVSCFFLKYFGVEKFPGIEYAEYLFWNSIPEGKDAEVLEEEGYILIDLGGGRFDHHGSIGSANEKCVSELVAEYLGIENDKALKKILAFIRRDDLTGRGIISEDPLDRAFGLPGLVTSLSRMLPDDQEAVLRMVMPFFLAHYYEQKKRTEDFPEEYETKLKNGQARRSRIPSMRGPINLVVIETDEIGMAGFLRNYPKINAHIVIQKAISGHVNIITRRGNDIDLSEIARLLRKAELRTKDNPPFITEADLSKPGKIPGVEEWFFDNKAITLQNGGVRPQGVPATSLSLDEIEKIVKEAVLIKL
ncbi:MAG: hypothetical protein KGJ13_00015 [Patescibacteria group bacterium]|nr:hypothetical protein [Patescibacteria group bacterium]